MRLFINDITYVSQVPSVLVQVCRHTLYVQVENIKQVQVKLPVMTAQLVTSVLTPHNHLWSVPLGFMLLLNLPTVRSASQV